MLAGVATASRTRHPAVETAPRPRSPAASSPPASRPHPATMKTDNPGSWPGLSVAPGASWEQRSQGQASDPSHPDQRPPRDLDNRIVSGQSLRHRDQHHRQDRGNGDRPRSLGEAGTLFDELQVPVDGWGHQPQRAERRPGAHRRSHREQPGTEQVHADRQRQPDHQRDRGWRVVTPCARTPSPGSPPAGPPANAPRSRRAPPPRR